MSVNYGMSEPAMYSFCTRGALTMQPKIGPPGYVKSTKIIYLKFFVFYVHQKGWRILQNTHFKTQTLKKILRHCRFHRPLPCGGGSAAQSPLTS